MFDRTAPPVGTVERREHRNTPPAYFPKVLYSAGRPTVAESLCSPPMRASPSVQSRGDDQTLFRSSLLVHAMPSWQLATVGFHISPEEFSTWHSPALVLGLVPTLNFERVALDVQVALAKLDLVAAATTLTMNGTTIHHNKVPGGFWTHWLKYSDPRFWVTGDIVFEVLPPGSRIILYGVRFDPAGIARLFPGLAAKPEAFESSPLAAKGGRPAGKNGEPIARVTKRLIALPPTELATHTAEAVSADLVEEYRRLELQPPSPDNAKRDAAGILRAVRN